MGFLSEILTTEQKKKKNMEILFRKKRTLFPNAICGNEIKIYSTQIRFDLALYLNILKSYLSTLFSRIE